MVAVFRKKNKTIKEIFEEISELFAVYLEEYLEDPIKFNLPEVILKLFRGGNFDLAEIKCGRCRTKGLFSVYGSYFRRITFFCGQFPIYCLIPILRLKCKGCGKTHAIISGILIIPYMQYSLPFVLTILYLFENKTVNVRDFAAKYEIAVSTIYRWRETFKEFYELLNGKLKALTTELGAQIEEVYCTYTDITSRLFGFLKEYEFCFFLSPKNRKAPPVFVPVEVLDFNSS